MKIERVEYRDWAEAYRCTVGPAELVVVTAIGPRILSLCLDGGPNVLFEDETKFGVGTWRLYGGHRFATAPESAASYTPDNAPCDTRIAKGRLVIAQPTDGRGMAKTWTIGPSGRTAGFEIVHELTNESRRDWHGAPWTCTCVKPHGRVVIPRPPSARSGSHGLLSCQPDAQEIGTPSGNVSLVADSEGARYWSMAGGHYAGPASPQWGWTADGFVIQPPLARGKVGLFSRESELTLVRPDLAFLIRATEGDLDRDYPHGGCNVEIYTSAHYFELETLGPLTTLAPGQPLIHRLEWQLLPPAEEVACSPAASRQPHHTSPTNS